MEKIALEEIKTGYDSLYPYNQVTMTSNGLMVELDDTPGNVRYHVLHPSGSFFEIHHSGDHVTKTVSNKQEIVLGNYQVQVEGKSDAIYKGKRSSLIQGEEIRVNENAFTHVVLKDHNTKFAGESKEIIGKNKTEVVSLKKTSVASVQDIRAGDTKPTWNEGIKQGDVKIGAKNNIDLVGKKFYATSSDAMNLKSKLLSITSTTINQTGNTNITGNVKITGSLSVSN